MKDFITGQNWNIWKILLHDCKNVTLTLGHYCLRIKKVSLLCSANRSYQLYSNPPFHLFVWRSFLHSTWNLQSFNDRNENLQFSNQTSQFINIHQHNIRSSFSHAESFTRKSQSRVVIQQNNPPVLSNSKISGRNESSKGNTWLNSSAAYWNSWITCSVRHGLGPAYSLLFFVSLHIRTTGHSWPEVICIWRSNGKASSNECRSLLWFLWRAKKVSVSHCNTVIHDAVSKNSHKCHRKEIFGKPGNTKSIRKNTYIYFLPISWGISWHKIATVVVTPVSVEDENAAPITKPSAKLWRLSPTRTIIANKLIFLPQKRKTNKQTNKNPVLTQTDIASFVMLQKIWGFWWLFI